MSAPVVLQLASSLRVGGAERMLVALMASAREETDFRHLVVIMNDEVDEGLHAELLETGQGVIRLGRPEGHWHPRYLLRLREIVRRHGVDVVHAHNEGARLWALLLKAVQPRLRVVYTLHNQGILPGYGRGARALYRLAMDATVAISGPVRAESEGFGLRRLVEIPNGVDLARFAAAAPSARAAGEALRLVHIGRFHPDKGQDLLLDALARLRAQGCDVRLLLAGPTPGDGSFLDLLQEKVRALALGGAVTFVFDRTDAETLLGEGDLFVMPSRREGFGLALVEAMAAGLPVVAARTGGLAEIVSDGDTGFLVPAQDPASLSRAIAVIADDPVLAARLAAAGRRRAEDFDIRAMRTAYHALYRDLAGGRGPAATLRTA